MDEIGGFFELELGRPQPFFPEAHLLNSGRNCLAYLLNCKSYKRVYLPNYICQAVVETVQNSTAELHYYSVDKRLAPILNFTEVLPNSVVYLINYFGITSSVIETFASQNQDVIIDNCQAFFSARTAGIDTIYSPRKFFGVADGGILCSDDLAPKILATDVSYDDYQPLLKRIDAGAAKSYSEFKKIEQNLAGKPLRFMSKLTKNILASINMRAVLETRNRNFNDLHCELAKYNEFEIETRTHINGPMIYPLLTQVHGLREYLIKNKVYIAKYWQETEDQFGAETVAGYFSRYLHPLPIDQRYGGREMARVLDLVVSYLKRE